jgi:putative MATE family efflux protein
MIVAALTNIILDPILIFGIGPIPAMGVAGAAIATVIGRGVAAVVLLGYFISGRSSYHLRPKHFLFRLRILKEIYRVGVASMVRMSAGSVIIALANRTAAAFGVIPLAIMGILIRASSFVFMPTVGLGQGMVPLVGYNFGARKKERVGEFVTKAGLIGLIWGMMCFLAALLFSRQIIAIFSSDPELIAAGAEALRIFSLSLFTVGLQIILSFFFQGVGKGLPALVLSSSRQIIFLLPALLVLPRLFGPAGLWAAFPVADILAVTITIVWTVIQFRQLGIPFHLRYEQPAPVKKSFSA